MSYSEVHFAIKQGDSHYEYCETICKAANNLRNATLFRVRQVLTMFDKPKEKLTDNELEILHELETYLPIMGEPYRMPEKGYTKLTYGFLDALMKASNNPDYYCEGFSRQTAQNVIKGVTKEMDSFYGACCSYRLKPEAFTGKPRLPGYGKKGGYHTVKLTNQDCAIYPVEGSNNSNEVKLPHCKSRLFIGQTPINGRLKEVKIVPSHGIFVLYLTLETDDVVHLIRETPTRICSIDLGVDNFAAITNNIGKPCLLFKGETVKSVNQWYNKRMADIKSKQTKGTTKKFVPTPESNKLSLRRDNVLSDFMHKVAKQIIAWCVENDIDTIVVGENKGWKQEVSLGKVNNQNFVTIPFDKFKKILEFLCGRNGIRLMHQEESYTSKASFLDGDPIPVYGSGENKPQFSGKRRPTRYKGMYKKDGFRGLYASKDGTIINSDLNGSANIADKALPDIFEQGVKPDFSNVIVILHPDYANRKTNQEKQAAAKASAPMSKSKLHRKRRKEKVILLG